MDIYSLRIKVHISLLAACRKKHKKKVYRSADSTIDLSSCRLCRAIGDPSHRKNSFKPSNRALLRIAEVLCGCSIVQDSSLPHLVCRPCKQRLNNCLELQKRVFNNVGEAAYE